MCVHCINTNKSNRKTSHAIRIKASQRRKYRRDNIRWYLSSDFVHHSNNILRRMNTEQEHSPRMPGIFHGFILNWHTQWNCEEFALLYTPPTSRRASYVMRPNTHTHHLADRLPASTKNKNRETPKAFLRWLTFRDCHAMYDDDVGMAFIIFWWVAVCACSMLIFICCLLFVKINKHRLNDSISLFCRKNLLHNCVSHIISFIWFFIFRVSFLGFTLFRLSHSFSLFFVCFPCQMEIVMIYLCSSWSQCKN